MKKQKLDECHPHMAQWLCCYKFDGGMGFRDHNPHMANKDMADAVAASVVACLEGLCPEIQEVDVDASLLEECPIYEYFVQKCDCQP